MAILEEGRAFELLSFLPDGTAYPFVKCSLLTFMEQFMLSNQTN